MLVKMNDATATSALEGCSAALNSMPLEMRKSMTYDQGREMARHAEITQRTGVAIYFCDPHSPWQRGSNENINRSEEHTSELQSLMRISYAVFCLKKKIKTSNKVKKYIRK